MRQIGKIVLAFYLIQALLLRSSLAFTPLTLGGRPSRVGTIAFTTSTLAVVSESSETSKADSPFDENELIAKRLVVSGDVQGGYVRVCVSNEAGKFRRLVGTMTDPDTTSDRAEIYVEGKRKMVDGFVRWCQRGKVGLSQTMRVIEIIDEEPTGLYEGFYCNTK